MNGFLAALMFFTRLPFWRIKVVPKEYFKNVVNYWSFVGILTGGIMSLTYLAASFIFPISISIILALCSRLLITGCLHEDGLADFFDGFGGGSTKERILVIMKDSHIGTYGVISLIIYFVLFFLLLLNLPQKILPQLFIFADIFCKMVVSNIVNVLPYARKEEDSKIRVVYNRQPLSSLLLNIILCVVACYILFPLEYLVALTVPIFVFLFLILFVHKKIGGYTGDCCGAIFLMCELSLYLAIVGIQYSNICL